MTFGCSGQLTEDTLQGRKAARNIVDRCIAAGVNLFDTADVYSNGLSEQMLRQALGEKRKRVLIATKAFGRSGVGPNDVGSSRYHLVRACEESLRRLGTDWIDIYQLHGFDALTPLDETLRALDDLVRSGKVRYIGCSNFSGWHLTKACGISERAGLQPIACQQIHYSLVCRHAEYELIPAARDQGAGNLVWGPLAGGLLTGKYGRDGSVSKDARLCQRSSHGILNWELGYKVVDSLREIAVMRDVPISQVALNWLLRKPGVTSLIVGARKIEQLEENLGTIRWELSAEEVKALDDVSTPPDLYPYWHQRHWGRERNL